MQYRHAAFTVLYNIENAPPYIKHHRTHSLSNQRTKLIYMDTLSTCGTEWSVLGTLKGSENFRCKFSSLGCRSKIAQSSLQIRLFTVADIPLSWTSIRLKWIDFAVGQSLEGVLRHSITFITLDLFLILILEAYRCVVWLNPWSVRLGL